MRDTEARCWTPGVRGIIKYEGLERGALSPAGPEQRPVASSQGSCLCFPTDGGARRSGVQSDLCSQLGRLHLSSQPTLIHQFFCVNRARGAIVWPKGAENLL